MVAMMMTPILLCMVIMVLLLMVVMVQVGYRPITETLVDTATNHDSKRIKALERQGIKNAATFPEELPAR